MTAEATCAHCGKTTIEPLPFRCGGIAYMLCETCYPAPAFKIGAGAAISADGFIATQDGPIHVDDIAGVLDECRQQRDDLLTACKSLGDVRSGGMIPWVHNAGITNDIEKLRAICLAHAKAWNELVSPAISKATTES